MAVPVLQPHRQPPRRRIRRGFSSSPNAAVAPTASPALQHVERSHAPLRLYWERPCRAWLGTAAAPCFATRNPPGLSVSVAPRAGACPVPYTRENPWAGRAKDAIRQRCSSFNHHRPPVVATRSCRHGRAACGRPDATSVGCYDQYPLRHCSEQYLAPIGIADECPIAPLVRPATHGRAQGPGRGHRRDPGWQGRLCLRLRPAPGRRQRDDQCRHVVLGRFRQQGGHGRRHAARSRGRQAGTGPQRQHVSEVMEDPAQQRLQPGQHHPAHVDVAYRGADCLGLR
ncbi:hypothetical protein D3C81_712250 [compost metagenome]